MRVCSSNPTVGWGGFEKRGLKERREGLRRMRRGEGRIGEGGEKEYEGKGEMERVKGERKGSVWQKYKHTQACCACESAVGLARYQSKSQRLVFITHKSESCERKYKRKI